MSLEKRQLVCDPKDSESDDDFVLYDDLELPSDVAASWNTMSCDFSDGIISETTRDDIK